MYNMINLLRQQFNTGNVLWLQQLIKTGTDQKNMKNIFYFIKTNRNKGQSLMKAQFSLQLQ